MKFVMAVPKLLLFRVTLSQLPSCALLSSYPPKKIPLLITIKTSTLSLDCLRIWLQQKLVYVIYSWQNDLKFVDNDAEILIYIYINCSTFLFSSIFNVNHRWIVVMTKQLFDLTLLFLEKAQVELFSWVVVIYLISYHT